MVFAFSTQRLYPVVSLVGVQDPQVARSALRPRTPVADPELRHPKPTRCHTGFVPTIKQRITVTATGELERILNAEARLHPDLSPSALVAMLIERGHVAGSDEAGREGLVRGLAGTQSYPADYLKELRDDWPD